ncbi:hypothetical protein K3495_g13147 [Podosphaera aphanis]|nr:hypothetical protein K3495_g13147 [Podosphaera aphanis]
MSRTSVDGDILTKKLSLTSRLSSTPNSFISGGKSVVASIYQMWSSISMQITEYNNIIVIPSRMFALWSAQDHIYLLSQYRSVTVEDGMFVADCALPRVFLGPVSHFRSKNLHYMSGYIPILLKTSESTSEKSSRNLSTSLKLVNSSLPTFQHSNSSILSSKPVHRNPSRGSQKRPPNSWILYRKAKHEETVARNPGLSNNQISTLISSMWATESNEVRNVYKDLADRAKRQHAVENPGYRYKPRKPSEVKRRQKRSRIQVEKSAKLTLMEPITSPTSSFHHEQVFNALELADNSNETLDYYQNSDFPTSPALNSWPPGANVDTTTSFNITPSQSSTVTLADTDEIDFDQWFNGM